MMLRASTQMMLCPADTNEKIHRDCDGFFGGATRNRTGDRGVADLCLTAWLWRRIQLGKGEGDLPRFRISALGAGKSSPVSENSGLGLNEKWARKLRAHEWSGLRGSNPPPPPWQGGALPNELNPRNGASGRNRTNDTGIFSPLLYQLSYRGIQQGLHL